LPPTHPAWLERVRRGGLLLTVLLYSSGYGSWGLFLLLITTVLDALISRRLPWARSRLDVFVAAFLAAFLISGLLSPYRPVALGSVGLAAVTVYVAFGSTAAALRRDPSFLRPLAVAWVAGGVGAAALGIILRRGTALPASTQVLGQNALGTTLLIATILAVGLVIELDGLPRRLAAGCGVLLVVGLIMTYTRGAWLGVLVGGALLLAASGARRVVAGSVAVLLIVVTGFALVESERTALLSRAASIPDLSANQDRLLLIRTALSIFAAHPVSGTGLNTFPLVYPSFRGPDDPNPLPLPFAHNIFVNMAAEGGALGFVTFLAVVLAGITAGWRWHRAARLGAGRAPAVIYLSAFVGAMVHQLFDGTLLSVHLGLGMWVLLAILSVGSSQASEAPEGRWTSV